MLASTNLFQVASVHHPNDPAGPYKEKTSQSDQHEQQDK